RAVSVAMSLVLATAMIATPVSAQETKEETETVVSTAEVLENADAVLEVETDDKAAAADLVITSLAEFKNFAHNAGNYKVVKLAADITFDGTINNFTPISGFKGTFDGCGYTISGIDVTLATRTDAGVFGDASGATIQKLTVKDSHFETAGHYGGAIAAKCSEVKNCHNVNTAVTMSPYGSQYSSGQARAYIGGVAGMAETVLNCSSSGAVEGNGEMYFGASVGGVAGSVSSIYNSFSTGMVSGNISISGDYMSCVLYTGGIAGSVGSMIQNCYNVGTVSATNSAERKMVTGGIAGSVSGTAANNYYAEDSASYDFGSISGVNKANKVYTYAEMQGAQFTALLNSNLGNSHPDWLSWVQGSDGYPKHVPLIRMSDTTVTLSGAGFTYTGDEICPAVTVSYNGATLVLNQDYQLVTTNNIEPGTATVSVEGLGRYIDSVERTFEITKGDITNAAITLSETSCVYDGYEKTPEVTVVLDGKTLMNGTDYTVSYQNNVSVGTASVTITGDEVHYTGTVTKTFSIKKRTQSLSVKRTYTKTYGDKAFTIAASNQTGAGKLSFKSSNKSVATVNSKTGRVTIKGTGRTIITVTAAATTGYAKTTAEVTVNVKPVKQTASISSVSKKALTVKWKKDSRATGYEVQYAADKKFKKNMNTVTVTKKAASSKKISKLKSGKDYYVRVRSFKVTKVNGKNVTVYGAWSKTLKSSKVK
ncbi:MAG: fibronectin type III domain-containing protein, partial [Roseburia sp.]|nr:fibronectin type III domain-containing protein [Roseburia sp.]